MAKAKKEKPLLHLVRGDKDPELFNSDLEWFFNCSAALAGHRSSMGAQTAVLQGIAGGSYATESNFYSEPETGWPTTGGESYFTRMRRIWWALERVSWDGRLALAVRYEPRKYFAPEYQGATEAEIRAAHREYADAVKGWKRDN
jgi:hypothetical protein